MNPTWRAKLQCLLKRPLDTGFRYLFILFFSPSFSLSVSPSLVLTLSIIFYSLLLLFC